MKKTKLSFYFIFIAFSSFIAIFLAIVQKSYTNLMSPIKEVESNKLLTPINPDLNVDIIKDIESRPEHIDTGGLNFIISSPNTSSSPSTQSAN